MIPLLRRLQDRSRRRGIVLLYHRIARHGRDPWALEVAPEIFRGHLEVIGRRGQVVPLQQLVEGRAPRRAIALTFDDAYIDLLTNAEPELRRFGFPATTFALSDAQEVHEELWWDRLERLLLDSVDLPRELHLVSGRVDYRCELSPHTWEAASPAWRGWCAWRGDDPSPRHRALRELRFALLPLPAAEQDAALEGLARWSGQSTPPRPDFRPLSQEELRKLDSGGLVAIGAHTRTHCWLAGADRDRQHDEIEGSKRRLEATLGHAVAHFAYPYGGRTDYDATSVELAEGAGFQAAFSNFAGVVEARSPRFELPRHQVPNLLTGEFDAWLAGILEAA